MNTPLIVGGLRIPFGKFGRSLRDFSAVDLGAYVIKGLLDEYELDPGAVELVIMGHVIRAGTGMNTARQAALRAGIPESVDAMNVDMVCASSMAAIITAATYVRSGEYDVIIAGGMESMSQAPFLVSSRFRWGVKHAIRGAEGLEVADSMVRDGLYDVVYHKVMGEEADIIARRYKASREELDWISYESHRRAARAWDSGMMSGHVKAFSAGNGARLERDEGIRWDASIESLSSLEPAFSEDGLHTAGSSSQLSDGAAALLIVSERASRRLGLEPRAYILGHSYVGVDPLEFPLAPIPAVKKLLGRLGWSVGRVDYWENNEAFAVNNYLMHKLLGVDYEVMNVHGGAIAIGHPLGASGARITLELLNVLERHGGRRGVASICHGLGGAAAIAIELV